MGVLAPDKIRPFVRLSRIFLGMHLSIKCMTKFGSMVVPGRDSQFSRKIKATLRDYW